MSAALHHKFRPTTWEAVVGQAAAVKSLRGVIKRKESQAFLLSGPTGVGKTTLARIAANDLGCERLGVLEMDAATYTGIDAMRDLQHTLQYQPFGTSKARAVILDESHRLSGQAWDSLLKSVEEPPPEAYWFFCTTNVAKVPGTIKSRCAHIQLQPVQATDLRSLLDTVCGAEKIRLSDDIREVLYSEARGSPRQLLVNLTLCRDARTRREAADILRSVVETDATLALCRFLTKSGGNWATAMGLIEKLKGEDPEGIRIVVVNYIGAALKNTRNSADARFFLSLLQCFSTPYHPAEGMAPLLLSVGGALFSE